MVAPGLNPCFHLPVDKQPIFTGRHRVGTRLPDVQPGLSDIFLIVISTTADAADSFPNRRRDSVVSSSGANGPRRGQPKRRSTDITTELAKLDSHGHRPLRYAPYPFIFVGFCTIAP